MNVLPEFPDFRAFTIDDIDWYYDFYISEGLNPYTDIHPGNLLVWLGINNDLLVSRLDSTVVLSYTNVLCDNQNNVIPLANPLRDSTVERIFSYLEEKRLPQELHEIPSKLCIELNQAKWLIEDDRDGFEYILDTEQQLSLKGSAFSRQRRRVNYFEREHSNDSIEIQFHNAIDGDIGDVFLHHIDTMPLNSSDKSAEHNTIEPLAIRKNIELAAELHKKALIIRINGEAVSLAICSYLDASTAAVNHLKVDYSVQYIFQYTIHQLARILKEDGIMEMNLEQDLGNEGLRTFKQRLQPSRLLEKRVIRPRDQ